MNTSALTFLSIAFVSLTGFSVNASDTVLLASKVDGGSGCFKHVQVSDTSQLELTSFVSSPGRESLYDFGVNYMNSALRPVYNTIGYQASVKDWKGVKHIRSHVIPYAGTDGYELAFWPIDSRGKMKTYGSAGGIGELQKESGGNNRPYFFLSINGSFPINDFASEDPFSEYAGFAQLGLGIGLRLCLPINETNTFIHMRADYIGRKSTIWENTLPFVQEALGASSNGAVLNEIKYRHLPVTFGLGKKVPLGQGGACMLITGFVGFVYNGLSSSSIRVGDDRSTIRFEPSGSASGGFGGSISLLSNSGVGLEVEYLQSLSDVRFALVESEFGVEQTFDIPVSMLNVKLLFALAKP